jgi:hypothetical protein
VARLRRAALIAGRIGGRLDDHDVTGLELHVFGAERQRLTRPPPVQRDADLLRARRVRSGRRPAALDDDGGVRVRMRQAAGLCQCGEHVVLVGRQVQGDGRGEAGRSGLVDRVPTDDHDAAGAFPNYRSEDSLPPGNQYVLSEIGIADQFVGFCEALTLDVHRLNDRKR